MILLGLTGSIGMGKTTTAAMFVEAGAALYDADAAVHQLYSPGGAAVIPVSLAFPEVIEHGQVSRSLLSAHLRAEPSMLAVLEAIVHPLVAQHRAEALEALGQAGVKLVVLEVPLLFETGGDRWVDATVVVTAPLLVQRQRVLARAGMDETTLELLLGRQLPDAEKRRRADFIIETSAGLEQARAQVHEVLHTLLDTGWRKPDSPL